MTYDLLITDSHVMTQNGMIEKNLVIEDGKIKLITNDSPDCDKKSCNVYRVISGGTGLIFKGSGFYLTDYKNKDSKKAETKDSKKSSKTEKKVSSPNKKSKTGETAK